jgi:hypothetical protein
LIRWQQSLAERLFWIYTMPSSGRDEVLKRELSTAKKWMTFPRLVSGKGYFQSLNLKQNMMDLLGLVKRLRRERPLRCVCEIGMFKGATLFLWYPLPDPDLRIFSSDLPGGWIGEKTPRSSRIYP